MSEFVFVDFCIDELYANLKTPTFLKKNNN